MIGAVFPREYRLGCVVNQHVPFPARGFAVNQEDFGFILACHEYVVKAVRIDIAGATNVPPQAKVSCFRADKRRIRIGQAHILRPSGTFAKDQVDFSPILYAVRVHAVGANQNVIQSVAIDVTGIGQPMTSNILCCLAQKGSIGLSQTHIFLPAICFAKDDVDFAGIRGRLVVESGANDQIVDSIAIDVPSGRNMASLRGCSFPKKGGICFGKRSVCTPAGFLAEKNISLPRLRTRLTDKLDADGKVVDPVIVDVAEAKDVMARPVVLVFTDKGGVSFAKVDDCTPIIGFAKDEIDLPFGVSGFAIVWCCYENVIDAVVIHVASDGDMVSGLIAGILAEKNDRRAGQTHFPIELTEYRRRQEK